MTHLPHPGRARHSASAADRYADTTLALPALFALAAAFMLSSCGNIWSTQETFVAGKNPVSSINGATIFPQLVPMGGEVKFGLNTMVYFAGVEEASAPYAIYVIAHGTPGIHEDLVIDDLKLHTSYGETEPLPASMLGKPVAFCKTTDSSVVQAIFGCDVVWHPGEWDEAGPVEVEVKATITASGTPQTHTFTQRLNPAIRKEKQFESIGGEFFRVLRRKAKLVSHP